MKITINPLITHKMNKIVLLLLLFTGMVKAQIVNIPDANFKAKLLAADVTNTIASTSNSATIPDTYNKIDVNNDGEIQVSEAANVTLLNVSNSNISDLTGIEEFISLHQLKCNGNQLTSLNINSSNILVWLDCQNNNITSLNISDKTFLQLVFCDNNQLSNLTLNNLPSLTSLYCGNNQLTTLDVSSLTSLSSFGCGNNQLTTLDVSNLINLVSLECSNNFINALNLNNTTSLESLNCGNNLLTTLALISPNLNSLYCSNNQLTSLSYSGTTNFNIFYCDNNFINNLSITGNVTMGEFYCQNNQIYSLDLSNVELVGYGDFTNNPIGIINIKNGFVENFPIFNFSTGIPFQYICADDNELSQLNSYLISSNLDSPITVINSYCSFTPEGNYNTITGSMIFDNDFNGCDISDPTQSNIRIDINDGTNQGATFTNNTGNYNFFTQAGSFDLTPAVENPTYFNFSPINATIPFANNNNNTATQNFCITANGIHPDIEVVITPITPARPGFDATYKIVYKNKGNQTLSGVVNVAFDDSKMDFISANPAVDNLAVNSLSWNYSNLLPFESRSIQVVFNINSPTETPAVNIGDVLNFTTTINPIAGDELPADNTFTYNQTVVGSYDPNNIECLEGNTVPASLIGEYLHYVINFENTGTYPAENIVVKTTIDPAKYDVNSLQMLNTSHNSYIRQNENVIEFIFENIALDTGGHGNILFKIKTLDNLVTGNIVSKRADIFFDYNAPIDTGIENTVFSSLNNGNFTIDESISMYPNPATSNININCNNKIQSIQLFDIQGRVVMTQLVDDLQTSLNISTYANGVYFVKVTSDKGVKLEKIVKE